MKSQAHPTRSDPWIGPDLSFDAARRRGTAVLSSASGDEAALDSLILLGAASGLDRLGMLGAGAEPIGPSVAARYQNLLDRRLRGEPTWRVLGTREFWGLTFEITSAVLDPRPDTEAVVSAALEAIDARRLAPLRMLDLGTGSGAILCALATELPNANGWGVDRSETACRVAARNARALGLTDRILVVNGNWGGAFAPGRFDLVVSNPPYIETDVIPTLAREVRDFDPIGALDGGRDGLDCYRRIAADLPRLLASGGVAVLEVGSTQAAPVALLLTEAGLRLRGVRRDMGGRERVVVAERIAT